jgi:hypothetical protein
MAEQADKPVHRWQDAESAEAARRAALDHMAADAADDTSDPLDILEQAARFQEALDAADDSELEMLLAEQVMAEHLVRDHDRNFDPGVSGSPIRAHWQRHKADPCDHDHLDPEGLDEALDAEQDAELGVDLVDLAERRAWVVPRVEGEMHGLNLALLDPADDGERRYLIRAEHPDLWQLIEDGVEQIEVDGEPMSPKAHIEFHAVVAEQLWNDQAPEAWRAVHRLLGLGYDRHSILHLLGMVLTKSLWYEAHGRPFDYDAALAALPGEEGQP